MAGRVRPAPFGIAYPFWAAGAAFRARGCRAVDLDRFSSAAATWGALWGCSRRNAAAISSGVSRQFQSRPSLMSSCRRFSLRISTCT